MQTAEHRYYWLAEIQAEWIVYATIVGYCAMGATLWNRWVSRLSSDDPLRVYEDQPCTGFGCCMDAAIFTVKLVFFLIWPVFAIIRTIYLAVDYFRETVDEEPTAIYPQIEDRSE